MNYPRAAAMMLPMATALLAVLVAGTTLGSQVAANPPHEARGSSARARVLMGSALSIEIEDPAPAAVFEEAFAEVARLEDVLSNWRATSELSRLNRLAAREAVRCSPDLFDAVSVALRWAAATGGDFDPTVEPLVAALGLRESVDRLPEGALSGDAPAEPVVAGALDPGSRRVPPVVGWRHVHLEAKSRSVRFDAPGMGIDLGGIGKGIALDAAARVLRRHGVHRALLDFGGQVLAVGSPSGAPGWDVGIADPGDRGHAVAVVQVADLSLATSSNSERSVSRPPGLVGHILDPVARRPALFDGSVTVGARDATSADALTKPLFVKGPEQGVIWAEERGIPALYVWRDPAGQLHRRSTQAFDERFRGNGHVSGE